jgi:ubiquinone/menaquinone biosynthesis C-methylase UbiE
MVEALASSAIAILEAANDRSVLGSADTGYQLGSDASELDRLDMQGRVLAPATRMILQTAGLARSMRVLDLGSGAGDVSFVAAELVGSSGEVVGIDQSPDSVAKATARAGERGLSNVRFVVGDIHDPAHDGPFDAIIGRLVLMYVSDPAAVLQTQASVLRSGGVVVPIEFDLHSARSLPSTPLVTQALSWLVEAFAAAHIDPALGPRLWTVALEAGLRPQGMIGVQPHFGPDDPDGPAILAGIVRTALPLIERAGAATAADVGADTLRQRISDELASAASVFAHPILMSAWSTNSLGG